MRAKVLKSFFLPMAPQIYRCYDACMRNSLATYIYIFNRRQKKRKKTEKRKVAYILDRGKVVDRLCYSYVITHTRTVLHVQVYVAGLCIASWMHNKKPVDIEKKKNVFSLFLLSSFLDIIAIEFFYYFRLAKYIDIKIGTPALANPQRS